MTDKQPQRVAKPDTGMLTRYIEILDTQGRFVAYVGGHMHALDCKPVRELLAFPDMLAALEAIRARINGEWDHPALMATGPIGSLSEDIERICVTAIAKARGQ